jgi:GWxTD domain-containing protein
MTALELWVETPLAKALGWTLFHFLWEGALIALVLAARLCLLRSPRARYRAACISMAAMVIAFAGTFMLTQPRQATIEAAHRPLAIPPAPRADAQTPTPPVLRLRAQDLLPWAAPFWIAGVLLFHLRTAASCIGLRRLRRTGVCCAPPEWQAAVTRLARSIGVSKPVMLLESCFASVPMAAGHLRPVIFMPLGVLTGLPAAQVESILLHELAHIRRHDYLVNLFQAAAEGFLFYHPAVWWISALIRTEREHCCDDLVVATSGDARQYAAALAALEQNRRTAHEFALAATGGSLVNRIRRLLQQPEGPRTSLAPVLSAVFLTIALAVAFTAWQSKLTAQTAPEQQRELSSPYRKWLNEDVAYIITDQERAVYNSLQTAEERDKFIEQFWLRRDPTPGTPENEFKEEHYRRIAYVNEHFSRADGIPGWKTDRGRVYITFGPPDEIEDHPGGNATTAVPFQQWRYKHIEGIGNDIMIEFVDPAVNGQYRMTTDPPKKEHREPQAPIRQPAP